MYIKKNKKKNGLVVCKVRINKAKAISDKLFELNMKVYVYNPVIFLII